MKFPLGINTSFSLTTAHTKIFTSYLLEISINDLFFAISTVQKKLKKLVSHPLFKDLKNIHITTLVNFEDKIYKPVRKVSNNKFVSVIMFAWKIIFSIINLVNPVFSHGCKFINFIEDETDAQIFSQIVIENTQLDRKSSGDEFWNRGEQNLLKALLLYVINYVKKGEDKNE